LLWLLRCPGRRPWPRRGRQAPCRSARSPARRPPAPSCAVSRALTRV